LKPAPKKVTSFRLSEVARRAIQKKAKARGLSGGELIELWATEKP